MKRISGTQVVLRCTRASGLHPGLTIYVESPEEHCVGEGGMSLRKNEATVELEAVTMRDEITS